MQWKATIDVKNIWTAAKDEDLVSDEDKFIEFRDKIVTVLRQFVSRFDASFSDLVDDLADQDDLDGFNCVWDSLYDWADGNKVWIATNF